MPQSRSVKLFKNGASQAVRLPAEFRFDTAELYATRDDATGNVVLSTRPDAGIWADFFALVHSHEDAGDFMVERPLNNPPAPRGPFDDVA